MPRADRLFVLARLLSGPARRSLDDLVRELHTSPRTIYRDLADLEARGIAVERVDGRYRFLGTSGVHSLPLSGRERILLTDDGLGTELLFSG